MAEMINIQLSIDEHHKKCVEALQQIALLCDCGTDEHRKAFMAHDAVESVAVPGWRVAVACREIANDVIGNRPLESRYKRLDRVRVKFGVDLGHYGTISSVGGDDGTYYGVKLDCRDSEVGYSEYELDPQNALKQTSIPEDLTIYKRAMDSMAAQMVHPKMTGLEMAQLQLKGTR